MYMPEIVGSGAALFDYDNDGDLDVYLVQGGPADPSKTPGDAKPTLPKGWRPGNRLFENRLIPEGKLRFVDATESAGAGYAGAGMGVAAGDYDNDGDLDLYVTNFGRNVLYRNDGGGKFTDVTAQSGAGDSVWSTSATFFDFDRDGRLDLFVANYVDFSMATHRQCFSSWGSPDYCGPNSYHGLPSRLFHNEGGGRFRDVSNPSGISSAPGPGLGVVAADLDGDGWPDVYVANDGKPNHLFRNEHNGRFLEAALPLGAAYAETGLPRAGMGVSLGDADGDGLDDLIVTNLTNEGATLYRNGGKTGFFDHSLKFGLHRPTYSFTGFGVGWFDYDNDGWLDLFVANGAVRAQESQRDSPFPYSQRNLLLHNEALKEGPGRFLRDAGAAAGPAMSRAGVFRAAAFGDVDNDGDIDVLVTDSIGPVQLLLNQSPPGRHWLLVRLDGGPSNRFGYGARIELRRAGESSLWRSVRADSSFLAVNDVRVHFGLGEHASIEALLVHWPDGAVERWESPAADRVLVLVRGSGTAVKA